MITAQRLQTLALIKIHDIHELESGFQIFIPERIKTSGVNQHQPCLTIPRFEDNPRICAASTLKLYLEITRNLRSTENPFLFLTTKKPFQKASKQTLSRWVKNTLNLAGIDSVHFKPHSTRHVSTSAAFRKGVSLDTIQQTAGWTQQSATFAKFYNRPLTDAGSFAIAILE